MAEPVYREIVVHNDWVLAQIRGWFDGAGAFVAGALVLFVIAVLALVLELQLPTAVLWTGQAVTGTERGGIVFFQWHGQQRTFSAPGYGSARTVIVYLDPSNPDSAVLDSNSDRIWPAMFIGVPALAGASLLLVGGTRNYRWKRRNDKRGEDWWLSRVPPGPGAGRSG